MAFDIDVTLRRGGRTIAARFATGPGITAVLRGSRRCGGDRARARPACWTWWRGW